MTWVLKSLQVFSERADTAGASNRISTPRKYNVLLKDSHAAFSIWFFMLGQAIRKQDEISKLE